MFRLLTLSRTLRVKVTGKHYAIEPPASAFRTKLKFATNFPGDPEDPGGAGSNESSKKQRKVYTNNRGEEVRAESYLSSYVLCVIPHLT